MISAAQIKRAFPKARADIVAAFVRDWREAEEAGIDTKRRVIWFFTQIGIETGGLRTLEEGLNYTSAERIRQTWPKRFPNASAAAPFVRQPRKLANKVYNGRMGNRVGSDDGWNYRGGGPIQTTGRSGYAKMGFEDDPDALRSPNNAVSIAVREWTDRGCNALIDKREDADLHRALRRAINGGVIGLEHSRGYLAAATRGFRDFTSGFDGEDTGESDHRYPPPDDPGGDVAGGARNAFENEHTIRLVQGWLRNLGYVEVGQTDGRLGPYTRSAIRDYRADHGLTPGDGIDEELVTALSLDKTARKIPAERSEATPKEVAEKVPEARAAWRTRLSAAWGAVTAAVLAVGNWLSEQFDALRPFGRVVRNALSDVPGWFWLVAIAAVLLGIAYMATQSLRAATDAWRQGARR